MNLLLQLFATFLKIGAFTFGGGYAMIALIQDEVVRKHAWMTAQEFTDLLAVSQMTPGPIGINTATYAGFTAMANSGASWTLSVAGAIVSSLAVILIPMLLMLVVCHFLRRYQEHPMVKFLLTLLRLVVIGLIASAALSLFTAENFGSPKDPYVFWISATLFGTVLWNRLRPTKDGRKLGPITLILIAGALGALLFMNV